MNNIPNNIAGDSWEKDLEDFAVINELYIRGISMTKLKAFIHKPRQEAIAGERNRILKIIEEMRPIEGEGENIKVNGYCQDCFNQSQLVLKIEEALTYNSNTSKGPICSDCGHRVIEDGENCIAGGTHDFPKY